MGSGYDYWLALAARLAPDRIVDLGCGTGALTVLLAELADTTGLDPDLEMLAVARSRPAHESVTPVLRESVTTAGFVIERCTATGTAPAPAADPAS